MNKLYGVGKAAMVTGMIDILNDDIQACLVSIDAVERRPRLVQREGLTLWDYLKWIVLDVSIYENVYDVPAPIETWKYVEDIDHRYVMGSALVNELDVVSDRVFLNGEEYTVRATVKTHQPIEFDEVCGDKLVGALILFKWGNNMQEQSPLIARIDTGFGLPLIPNGGKVVVVPAPEGLFSI